MSSIHGVCFGQHDTRRLQLDCDNWVKTAQSLAVAVAMEDFNCLKRDVEIQKESIEKSIGLFKQIHNDLGQIDQAIEVRLETAEKCIGLCLNGQCKKTLNLASSIVIAAPKVTGYLNGLISRISGLMGDGRSSEEKLAKWHEIRAEFTTRMKCHQPAHTVVKEVVLEKPKEVVHEEGTFVSILDLLSGRVRSLSFGSSSIASSSPPKDAGPGSLTSSSGIMDGSSEDEIQRKASIISRESITEV